MTTGSYAKIDRAVSLVGDLAREFKAYIDAGPFKVETVELYPNIDGKLGGGVFKVSIGEPVPEVCSVIVGEFAHNLRSALDHLTWADANRRGTAQAERANDIAFPIARRRKDYEWHRGRLAPHVSEQCLQVVTKAQPYVGGTDALVHVHELNRVDKHRLLVLVEGRILEVTDHRNDDAVDSNFMTHLGLVFGDDGPLKGQTASESMNVMVEAVRDVVDAFHKEVFV